MILIFISSCKLTGKSDSNVYGRFLSGNLNPGVIVQKDSGQPACPRRKKLGSASVSMQATRVSQRVHVEKTRVGLRVHAGKTRVSQHVHAGKTRVSLRVHAGKTRVSQRVHAGKIQVSQRVHAVCSEFFFLNLDFRIS